MIHRVWGRAAAAVRERFLGEESHPSNIESCFQSHKGCEKWSRVARMKFLALTKLELLNFRIVIS